MLNLHYQKYVLSISSNNYMVGLGGTNKAIKAHQELLNNNKISYLFLCPFYKDNKSQNNKNSESTNYWIVYNDGNYTGVYKTENIINQIIFHNERDYKLSCFFIHHLKDISIYSVQRIIDCTDAVIYLYIHDYYTICPCYTLIRNKGYFCGGGEVSSQKCEGCCHMSDAIPHFKKIYDFLHKNKIRLNIIAPSEAASKVWLKAYPDFVDHVKIIYHQTCTGLYQNNLEELSPEDPIRIAFVGKSNLSKGWEQWKRLVYDIPNHATNIELYHFGSADEYIPKVKVVPVDFRNDMNEMVNALRSNKIHCSILWSIWPETYSYTFYECFASNTFIITNKLSGNIKDQVLRNHNGVVLDNEDELHALIKTDNMLISYINHFRQQKIYGPEELHENDELSGLVLDALNKNGIIKTGMIKMTGLGHICLWLSISYKLDLIRRKFKTMMRSFGRNEIII